MINKTYSLIILWAYFFPYIDCYFHKKDQLNISTEINQKTEAKEEEEERAVICYEMYDFSRIALNVNELKNENAHFISEYIIEIL